MVFDPIKTVLGLGTIALLPESSYIEIGSFGAVVLRRLLYFTIKKVVVIIGIIINLLQQFIYISITSIVHIIVVENAVQIGFARADLRPTKSLN